MTGMSHRTSAPFLVVAVLLLAACSAPAAATPEPATDPTPEATSEPSAEPTADATSEASDPASPPASDPWSATAVEHRTEVGEDFTYDCPPDGEPDSIWGTDIYTDDSSICTAAVHVGAITVEDGGEVKIEIRPGEDSYEATERNGIESFAYGQWGGSFVIVDD
jgi:hypothetical protein